jgi:hypothetical protein
MPHICQRSIIRVIANNLHVVFRWLSQIPAIAADTTTTTTIIRLKIHADGKVQYSIKHHLSFE